MSPMLSSFGSLAVLGMMPGGDFESIGTVVVGSGGASSIDFTSIPINYQHLQIRMIGRCTAGPARHRMRLNSDSTAANYSVHLLSGDGTNAVVAAAANYGKAIGSAECASTNTAGSFAASVINILDYASTSKNKTIQSFSGIDLNGSGNLGLWSSGWFNTSVPNTVSLFWDSGNFAQHSTAALYGLRAP